MSTTPTSAVYKRELPTPAAPLTYEPVPMPGSSYVPQPPKAK